MATPKIITNPGPRHSHTSSLSSSNMLLPPKRKGKKRENQNSVVAADQQQTDDKGMAGFSVHVNTACSQHSLHVVNVTLHYITSSPLQGFYWSVEAEMVSCMDHMITIAVRE